jgi:hypothetical protein
VTSAWPSWTRQAGFAPDINERGNLTRQRWAVDGPPRVAVDFLVAPTDASELPGRIKSIEPDFAAIIAPGLRLAFEDRLRVPLEGRTIRGERAQRDVWVCGWSSTACATGGLTTWPCAAIRRSSSSGEAATPTSRRRRATSIAVASKRDALANLCRPFRPISSLPLPAHPNGIGEVLPEFCPRAKPPTPRPWKPWLFCDPNGN